MEGNKSTTVPTGKRPDRVREHTSDTINARLDREARDRVAEQAFVAPWKITNRLRELDEEWDIERALEANAATLALVGLTLGITTDRRWLAVPAVVGSFLLQHAVQGWCPPMPLLRRLGFRTRREIESERTALRIIRGDFERAVQGMDATEALRIARA